jgi:anthranilate synthase component 2
LAEVQHGVASTLTVVSDRLFEGLPSQFAVGRYHSWVVEESQLPTELEVIGRTTDQQIMAIRHQQFDLRGLQFHPESILTEHGAKLIHNWLQN